MAKIYETGESLECKKYELKLLALRYVHQWANLNVNNLEEDFYVDTHVNQIKHFNHISKSEMTREQEELINDNRLVDFSDEEKEWMRKEFQVIDNWLMKRRLGYINKLKILK